MDDWEKAGNITGKALEYGRALVKEGVSLFEVTEKIENKIKELEEKFYNTENFLEKADIADEIHNIKMKLNGVKPMDSHIDCIGCGS